MTTKLVTTHTPGAARGVVGITSKEDKATLACGCIMERNPFMKGAPDGFCYRFCHLHEAAHQLLAALEGLRPMFRDMADTEQERVYWDAITAARTAIEQASC